MFFMAMDDIPVIAEQSGNPPANNFVYLNAGGRLYSPVAASFSEGSSLSNYVAVYGNGAIFNSGFSLAFTTNIVGYQDTAKAATHHVFYVCYPGPPDYSYLTSSLCELYHAGPGDSGWTSHIIAPIATTQANGGAVASGLAAMWDGEWQHVYWNSAPGTLNETWYDTQWHNQIDIKGPVAPYYNMTATNPFGAANHHGFNAGTQWVWGQAWDPNQPNLSNGALSQYTFVPGGSSGETTPLLPNMSVASGTCSMSFSDATGGFDGAATDAAVFYVGTDNTVREYLPRVQASGILVYGVADGTPETPTAPPANRVYSPTQNQVACFTDPGGYNHVFYVTSGGAVMELYEPTSAISNGSTGFSNWTLHQINVGNVAAAH